MPPQRCGDVGCSDSRQVSVGEVEEYSGAICRVTWRCAQVLVLPGAPKMVAGATLLTSDDGLASSVGERCTAFCGARRAARRDRPAACSTKARVIGDALQVAACTLDRLPGAQQASAPCRLAAFGRSPASGRGVNAHDPVTRGRSARGSQSGRARSGRRRSMRTTKPLSKRVTSRRSGRFVQASRTARSEATHNLAARGCISGVEEVEELFLGRFLERPSASECRRQSGSRPFSNRSWKSAAPAVFGWLST